MSARETYCPMCSEAAKEWSFIAPTGYYRCFNCLYATPYHELPTRSILRFSGGPFVEPAPPVRISPYQRFYFTRDGGVMGFTSPVNPVLAAWDDTTQTAYRGVGIPVGNPWRMLPTKSSIFNSYGSEAFNATVGIANLKTLVLAYVSDALIAGTISGTAKGQIQWLQDFADCAQDQVTIALSVVSNNGLTNRGYLLPLGVYGTTNLFAQSPSPQQNRFLANGDVLTPVVAQSGDRLFLEIGSQPSTPPLLGLGSFISTYCGGQNPVDLLEDETDTATSSPWFELVP
jgi:hypothetical protein